MPGGKNNITGQDGIKFSSDHQPKNRRKSTKLLTDLLTKELKGKEEIIIEGINPETGLLAKVIISSPTKNQIVRALLKKAAKGNVYAIKEIFDRIEGKTKQEIGLSVDYDKLAEKDLDYLLENLRNKNQTS